MKVEKVISIDGYIVEKEFQKGSVVVYKYSTDDTQVLLFFVDSQTDEVMFKQEIVADYGQNTGYIDKLHFTGVN